MSTTFIKVGIAYLFAGIFVAFLMHHQQDRTLVPVHAHLTLAGGFLTMIFGLIYAAFPAAGRSKLAAWHFWLYNAAALGMIGFAVFEATRSRTFDDASPHLGFIYTSVAGLAAMSALITFAANVFLNIRESDVEDVAS